MNVVPVSSEYCCDECELRLEFAIEDDDSFEVMTLCRGCLLELRNRIDSVLEIK